MRDNQIYTDCNDQNATSLIISLKYLDSGSYPSYNCLIHKTSDQCGTNCSYFSSQYQLILIQQVSNFIEPDWKGLSNCNIQPNIELIQDPSIKLCTSFASSLTRNSWLAKAFITLFIFHQFIHDLRYS